MVSCRSSFPRSAATELLEQVLAVDLQPIQCLSISFGVDLLGQRAAGGGDQVVTVLGAEP